MSGAAGGGIAAAVAAKKRREREQEEEQMAGYTQEDLKGWEFKFVRSFSGKFGNPQFLKKICAEEKEAGWELVEKFDDNRLRFKRRVEERANDQQRQRDPYRSTIGLSENRMALVILGIVLLIGGAIFLLAMALS